MPRERRGVSLAISSWWKERFYEARRVLWLEDLQKDLRYALRTISHSPIFAATVVLTLALGIGATAAIFSVTDAALIRPLPFPEAQRLVSLYERWEGDLDSLAPADYLDYLTQAKSFEGLAGYRHDSFNLGGQNRPERVLGAIVTPSFFAVLKVPPALGRTLNSVQDKPGDSRTVVLSYSLWKRRYGGSSGVIGTTISMDGEPRVVVGVMPPYFAFPGNVELWAAARFPGSRTSVESTDRSVCGAGQSLLRHYWAAQGWDDNARGASRSECDRSKIEAAVRR